MLARIDVADHWDSGRTDGVRRKAAYAEASGMIILHAMRDSTERETMSGSSYQYISENSQRDVARHRRQGEPGAEPTIDLDTMLDLTAAAEVDGIKFDGVDLFLYDPHINIDITDEELKATAAKIADKGFMVGSVVAPVWFDASAMGDERSARTFLTRSAKPAGSPRSCASWACGRTASCGSTRRRPRPTGPRIRRATRRRSPRRSSRPAAIARDHGERLAAEGEICWGGMHSWRTMVDLLERVGEPETVGFQADMAHTLLYTLGENAPEDRILPKDYDWKDRAVLDEALKTLTAALRPWTIDFHVAQNDATVFGSGSHDHTGRHCLATDPNGKLDIPHHAGLLAPRREWQADQEDPPHLLGRLHVPQRRHDEPKTWNDILAAMIAVRDAHGWKE